MMNKPISDKDYFNRQVKMFKALGHPNRLGIINILRDGEHCVYYIKSHLGLDQAYCSQQLAILRKVGLVKSHRDGQNVIYKVVDPRLYVVANIIEDLAKL